MANLDPAAEHFQYEPLFDVRELISVTEVMEELSLGPNGALVYSMEYLLENVDWLRDALDDLDDDEYILLDCPGQLELYTHVPIMKSILDSLKLWGYDGHMVSIFCVDAAFLVDLPKFLSGSLLALSAMVALELPHVNVLTKADLMPEKEVESILSQSATELWYQERDRLYGGHLRQWNNLEHQYTREQHEGEQEQSTENAEEQASIPSSSTQQRQQRHRRDDRLTDALCQLLEDYSMVGFIPLNIKDEESVEHVLSTADHAIQYGEDLEVRGADQDDFDNDVASSFAPGE